MLATTFGLGLLPLAPGTFGTLGGVALFWALQPVPDALRWVAYVVLVAVGSWSAARMGKALGSNDHDSIVIDETLGMALLLEITSGGWAGTASAFVLFRIFDVLKPWPIYLADRGEHGGFFVILDDLLAAAWAAVVLYVVMRSGLVS